MVLLDMYAKHPETAAKAALPCAPDAGRQSRPAG